MTSPASSNSGSISAPVFGQAPVVIPHMVRKMFPSMARLVIRDMALNMALGTMRLVTSWMKAVRHMAGPSIVFLILGVENRMGGAGMGRVYLACQTASVITSLWFCFPSPCSPHLFL